MNGKEKKLDDKQLKDVTGGMCHGFSVDAEKNEDKGLHHGTQETQTIDFVRK